LFGGHPRLLVFLQLEQAEIDLASGKVNCKTNFSGSAQSGCGFKRSRLEGDAVLGLIRVCTAAGVLPASSQRAEELEALFTHVTPAREQEMRFWRRENKESG